MKKAIVAISIAIAAVAVNAERLQLKYSATVNVLDETGHKISTRQIKAGTEITIVETKTGGASEAPATSKVGKTSGISPAQFLAERRTTPTTFVGVGTLDPKPVIFDEKRISANTHWCAMLGLYGKTRKAYNMASGYALKSSQVGKALYDMLKDGEQHKVLVTVRCFPNTKHPDEVEVTAIKELTDDDPLIKALMATDY